MPHRYHFHTGALAAAAGLGFLLLVLALQWARSDLAWTQAQLSLYLHGPYGLWLRSAYCVLALAMALLALGLQGSLAPAQRSVTTLVLFWCAGVGLSTVAVGDSYLPALAPDLAPLIHRMAAQAAFLCVTAALLLQSWRFRADAYWRRYFLPAWTLAWMVLVVLILHIGLRVGPRGLGQKTAIVLIVAWLVLTGLWLARRASPARSRDNAALLQNEEA